MVETSDPNAAPASDQTVFCARRAAVLNSKFFLVATLLLCATSFSRLSAQAGADCDAQRAFARADTLLKTKHYAETKAILKELSGCRNLTPATSFSIGWLYGRSQDFRTALKIFRSIPSNVPDIVTHQYAIALAEFEIADYKQSVEALKPLQSEAHMDAKCGNLLGVSYSKLGLYQNAYDTLADNLSRNPSDLLSYLNLITLLADAGHFSDAEDVANQAVTAFPGNPEVLVVRGAAETLQGELDKAEVNFAAAARLAPRQPSTRFFLALSEYRKGDYESASREIRSAIASDVADSDLHYLLAECSLKTDPSSADGAIAELDRAISMNRNAVAALTLRGKLLLESGKVKQALPDLTRAHRLDPGFRSAAYNLARAEFKLGRTQEANALFRKLKSENGNLLIELSDQRLHKALSPEAER
jgi:tetratricopeptide (TPR) repeat protein